MEVPQASGLKTYALTEDEAKLLDDYRSLEEKKDKFTRDYLRIAMMFGNMGTSSGDEITKLAVQLHPDPILVWPLYRSCIIIPKQEVDGDLTVIGYHDPSWMGDDRTVENLPRYRETFTIRGQRSGVEFFHGEDELVPYYRIVVTDPRDPNFHDSFEYIVKFREVREKLETLIDSMDTHGSVQTAVEDARKFLVDYDRKLEEELKARMERALERQKARMGEGTNAYTGGQSDESPI